MKLQSTPILDWQGEVGCQEPLHTHMRTLFEQWDDMGQNTYRTIDRKYADEDESGTTQKVFDEVERLTGERHDQLLLLCWW